MTRFTKATLSALAVLALVPASAIAERSRNAAPVAQPVTTAEKISASRDSIKVRLHELDMDDTLRQEAYDGIQTFVSNYSRAMQAGNEKFGGMTAEEVFKLKLGDELLARGIPVDVVREIGNTVQAWVGHELALAAEAPKTAEE